MSIFKTQILFRFYLGVVSVFLLASCIEGSKKTDLVSVDAFEIWNDTVVQSKYENGSPAVIWGYRDGDSLHYEWKYYRNGQLWVEGPLYKNLRHGKWKSYDDQGNFISTGTYKLGKSNGTRTVWHANGKKYYEGEHVDGVRVGVWCFYDKEGKLIKELDYSK